MTIFLTFFPLTFKFFSVCPGKLTIAFSFAIDEGTAVNAFFCLFYSFRFLIFNEFALKPLFFSQKNT
jgi:hypothetical protein